MCHRPERLVDVLTYMREYKLEPKRLRFVCDRQGGCQINATRYEMLVDPIAIGQGVVIVIGTDLQAEKIRKFMTGDEQ